jgi:hypothetical protein
MDARQDTVAEGNTVLPEALTIVQPLVDWLLRSGVGYAEFVAALKPVFLAQAKAELERLERKPTDSALSLLSGLHRKDVRAFREEAVRTSEQAQARGSAWGKPSAASQVVSRWLGQGHPEDLPVHGPAPSFEQLARSVSTDFHPRSVLDEMLRLGVARQEAGQVRLVRNAFVPDRGHREARQLLAGSVADHLAAGVHNLSDAPGRRFLEQSVFADGLSVESAQRLERLASDLWSQVLRQVVDAAVPMCERDAGTPRPRRFRLGMFAFSAPEFGGARSEVAA